MEDLVSILIPSRNEKYLNRTIKDLQTKAQGKIEIIVILEENDEERLSGVKYIHNPNPAGMKYAINQGVELATGKYLMKIDGHSIVSEGFDTQLIKDHQPDWIQVPRRYKLDEENWKPLLNELPIDYEYWIWPLKFKYPSLHGFRWYERGEARKNPIDENLTFQGSFWFMTREWWDRCDFMHDEGYNELHSQEAAYLGNTTWFAGGKVMTNKNLWYCHLHSKRGYGINNKKREECYKYSYKHWVLHNKEKFTELINRFWPIPNWTDAWEVRLWKI